MWVFLGLLVVLDLKTKLLQGAFGHPHNKRQQIVHTEKITCKRIGTRLSTYSIHHRRNSEAVSEIQWALAVILGRTVFCPPSPDVHYSETLISFD